MGKQGLFDNIREAKVSNSGVYFLPGLYRVKITECKMIESRKKVDMIVVEAMILESDVPTRKPGTKAAWVLNMTIDAAMGNFKGFLAAAMGQDPSDEEEVDKLVTKEAALRAISDENPLEGVELRLVCVNKVTKEGKDFTLHQWSPVEE